MRIAYCTNVRLPSERAHGRQIAKVVEALMERGHEVEVFAPFRKNPIEQSFESYYGLASPVTFHRIGSFDGIASFWTPGILGLKVTTWLFAKNLKKALAESSQGFHLIYTRTPEILPALLPLGIPVILELHRIPYLGRSRFLKLIDQCKLVVALTSQMRQSLIEMGVSSVPVIAEGDAVDLHEFESLPNPQETRAALNVPPNIPLIVYTGQLKSMGLSKGIPELLGALELLQERGLSFHAVIAGGPDAERVRFERSLSKELRPHLQFTGHISHLKIPTLLTAADILVYPAPKSSHPFYMRDTSPLKLFEYMAAERPIVTADLPPIHDALDPTMAIFVPPGNAQALADGIREVLEHPEDSEKRSRLARAHSENFTWEKRMERILTAARMGGNENRQ